MLAVWLDDPPSCSKEQRDPDAWTTGAARAEHLAERLAELAHAPVTRVVWVSDTAAQWWGRIEEGRRRAKSKERAQRNKDAVLAFDIPKDIEDEGRRVAADRLYGKGRLR